MNEEGDARIALFYNATLLTNIPLLSGSAYQLVQPGSG